MEIDGVPVDVVRYPYPLLESRRQAVGFPVAALHESGAIRPRLRIDGEIVSDGPDSIDLGVLGPFVIYYFDPSKGFHVEGQIGAAILRADNDSDVPIGVGASVGVGYEWWTGAQGSIGVVARAMYGFLRYNPSGLDERHSVIAPSILGEFTYHQPSALQPLAPAAILRLELGLESVAAVAGLLAFAEGEVHGGFPIRRA